MAYENLMKNVQRHIKEEKTKLPEDRMRLEFLLKEETINELFSMTKKNYMRKEVIVMVFNNNKTIEITALKDSHYNVYWRLHNCEEYNYEEELKSDAINIGTYIL